MRSERGLSYTDTDGDGDVLVFVHGWGARGSFFDWVIERLPDFRCIAVDLPGFGDSRDLDKRYPCDVALNAELVHDLVQELGVRPVLVGHSMGGMISQEYAITYPDDLTRVILIDTSPSPSGERRWRFLVPMSPLMYPFGIKPAMRWFARTYAMNRRTASREAIERMHSIAVDNRKRRLRSCIAGMRDWSALERLGDIKVPIMIVHGSEDRMIGIEGLDVFRRALPNVRYEVIDGVGHSPPLEAPGRTARLIESFVRS